MREKHWDLLQNFESFELVKKDYSRRHGLSLSTGHAREIAAHFAHARSYFSAARTAPQTVRPLLLYYGVVAISRALTLVLVKGRREASLGQSHGLAARGWSQHLCRTSPDFASIQIVVSSSGTLIDLDSATEHASLLRTKGDVVSRFHKCEMLLPGSEVSLGDLLSRIPALQEHHHRWRGYSLCLQGAVQVEAESAIFRVRKNGDFERVDRAICDRLFAGSSCEFVAEDDARIIYSGADSPSATPGLTDKVYRDLLGIGDGWIVARYPQAESPSKIATLFALSFILGMVVRYHPTQWTALIQSQVSDAALPTINSAVSLVEYEYPSVVVDFLLNKFEPGYVAAN